MNSYLYTTRINQGDEWLEDMLTAWKRSGQKYLCFPWIDSKVHTIKDHRFWLYMYYSHTQSDIPEMMGVVEYRLGVTAWAGARFSGPNIYPARHDEPGTIWFLCDRYEQIKKEKGGWLTLDNFHHAHNKRLGSTMRNSIPPVVCTANLVVTMSFP